MKKINDIQSIKGFDWMLKVPNEGLVQEIVDKRGIHPMLVKLMINRGIKSPEEASVFLSRDLRAIFPDPFLLGNMEGAVETLLNTMGKQEKVHLFTDYDVDGTSAAALLIIFLREVGFTNVDTYIPHRLTEGYGPNSKAISEIHEGGAKLLIFIDCGTNSVKDLREATLKGMKCIILDHHNIEDGTERVDGTYLVNPNTSESSEFRYKQICAATVVLLFVVALRAKMRERKMFINKKEPNVTHFTAFSALGTICDVMPLNLFNRCLVYTGMEMMLSDKFIGISAMIEYLKLGERLSAFHLGFVIGPRLNAGGRIESGNLALKLFIEQNKIKARERILILESLNETRKTLEKKSLEDIFAKIEKDELYKKRIIIVHWKSLPYGLLGIFASRIKEYYNKPAIIISIDEERGKIKGSMRSIYGINMVPMIMYAKSQNLLDDGGGHPMAGGFNAPIGNLQKIIDCFDSYMLEDEMYHEHMKNVKILDIDAILSIDAFNQKIIQFIEPLEPLGTGNPHPRFAFMNVKIYSVRTTNDVHLSFQAKSAFRGNNQQKKRIIRHINCFYFRGVGTELGNFLLSNIGNIIHIVGILKIENQRRISLSIEDACLSKLSSRK